MKERLRAARMSQAELAQAIHLSPSRLSRIATGAAEPTEDQALAIDTALGACGELAALAGEDELAFLAQPAAGVDERVAASQQSWAATRRALGSHRGALTRMAYDLYPPGRRLPGAPLLTRPEWVPDRPVPLDQLTVEYAAAATPPIDGTGGLASHILPRQTITSRYTCYSLAIRDLMKPRLFANRLCWRLTGVDGTALRFAECLYMDGVNVQEAVAHELALAALSSDRDSVAASPRMRDLPLRRAIDDPTDLSRRPSLAAISTLTIRLDRDGDASFLLHHRDPAAVLQDGGSMQVVPSGVFQPSSSYAEAKAADFDPWRNIMREAAEELLGFEEHGGDGRPVDYAAPPLGELDEAYRDGRVRVWHLATAVDALTMFGEVLTVAVWDAEFYDQWCRDLVCDNDEGSILDQRVPFTESVVRQVLASGRILPAGAGCLSLAWEHRDTILA